MHQSNSKGGHFEDCEAPWGHCTAGPPWPDAPVSKNPNYVFWPHSLRRVNFAVVIRCHLPVASIMFRLSLAAFPVASVCCVSSVFCRTSPILRQYFQFMLCLPSILRLLSSMCMLPILCLSSILRLSPAAYPPSVHHLPSIICHLSFIRQLSVVVLSLSSSPTICTLSRTLPVGCNECQCTRESQGPLRTSYPPLRSRHSKFSRYTYEASCSQMRPFEVSGTPN